MGIRSCLHQHGTTIESVPWCKSYSPVLLQPFICQPSCKPYPPVPLQPFVCHGWALVVTDYEGYEGEEGPPLNQFVTPAVLNHLAATTSLTRLVFQRPLDEPPKRREEEVKGWCQHIAQLQQLRHLEFGGEYALGGSARCLAKRKSTPTVRCAGRHTLSLSHEDGLLINIAAIKRSSEQA